MEARSRAAWFPTPLASYEEERLRVAADVLGLSSGLQRENYDRLASETIAENNRDIYQLNLSYRGASAQHRSSHLAGRVQAGDRAPDAPCALASGMPTRLFEQFRGPHWTILQFGAVSERPASLAEHVKWLSVSSAGGGGQLVDRDGLIARAYGLSSTREELLAIRPDGYIGMACEELVITHRLPATSRLLVAPCPALCPGRRQQAFDRKRA